MATTKLTPEQEVENHKSLETHFKAQKASAADVINTVTTTLTVHCATILVATDWNGLCDAWVEIVEKGGVSFVKTDVREKTLSPYWNKIQSENVIVKDTYKVVVYDKDKVGKSKVGTGFFTVPIDNDRTFQTIVWMKEMKDVVVPIVNKDKKVAAYVTISIVQQPAILPSI